MSPRPAPGVLTPRQLDVLRIVVRSIDTRGFPPTIREILAELGISPNSRETAHEHLARLEANGMLVRHARIARGLSLTEAGRERGRSPEKRQ